jgi:hypothetical protein
MSANVFQGNFVCSKMAIDHNKDVKTTLMMSHGEIRIQEVDIWFRV